MQCPAIPTSDSSASYMGADVTADLHGEQEGDYQIDIKTGMLKSGEIRSNLKGSFQTMGREVPVSIKTQVSIEMEASSD